MEKLITIIMSAIAVIAGYKTTIADLKAKLKQAEIDLASLRHENAKDEAEVALARKEAEEARNARLSLEKQADELYDKASLLEASCYENPDVPMFGPADIGAPYPAPVAEAPAVPASDPSPVNPEPVSLPVETGTVAASEVPAPVADPAPVAGEGAGEPGAPSLPDTSTAAPTPAPTEGAAADGAGPITDTAVHGPA